MKKLILILTLCSVLFSCSNVGNASNSDNNPPLTATPVNDIDGNSYNTVIIGTQVWMQRNLDVTHYRNGDVIPQVTDSNTWAHLTSGAWCYYNNETANGPIYGKLYNWYAVSDPRGLAPVGCHIPTDNEFQSLIIHCQTLGGNYGTNGKLRETGFAHWFDPNYSSNETGFTALGAGIRILSIDEIHPQYNTSSFQDLKAQTKWWTSTPFPGSALNSNMFIINDLGSGFYGRTNNEGVSVRCIKD